MDWLLQNAPTIGLASFFCGFVGIVIWTLQPRRKNELQALAQIPLKEENENGRK